MIPVFGVTLIISYVTGGTVNFVGLVKVPLSMMFLILVAFHFKYYFRATAISAAFLVFGLQALMVGFVQGTLISTATVTHLFMTIMPCLAISFGLRLATVDHKVATKILQKTVNMIYRISVIVLCIYLYLHFVSGSIAYYGFDTYLPFVAGWFFAKGNFRNYCTVMFLITLSGKRAALLVGLLPMVLQYLQMSRVPTISTVIRYTLIAGVAMIGFGGAYEFGLLDRFDAVLQVLSIDLIDIFSYDEDVLDILYLGTGGRSAEVLGLWAELRDNPLRFLFGSGFGGHFTIMDSAFSDGAEARQSHYLHFSILTYLLVYGIIFFALILSLIGKVFWSRRRHLQDFYYIGMLMSFFGSLFGAGLIVETTFWVFLGVNHKRITSPVDYQ